MKITYQILRSCGQESEVIILEDEIRNLKGTKDTLRYYRLNDTGTYEERSRIVQISNEPQSKLYYYPLQEKILFSDKEVRKFSLDSYGESIPYVDGELTIFNNYFFDFWGYYLGAEGTSLYGHLKRFAYGEKDWCYPNFELISEKMDKHRKTLYKYLYLLERYGFAYQFGVINESKNNIEESPLFKIRKQIPLLTHKLIYGDPELTIPENTPSHIVKAIEKEKKGLPPRLRAAHEQYVEKRLQNNIERLEKQIDFEKIYSVWMEYGEVLQRNQSKHKQPIIKPKSYVEMNEQEHILLNFILKQAQELISKPSFETWFKELSIKIENKNFIIFAPNEFAKDWLQQRYKSLLNQWIESLGYKVDDVTFEVASN